MVIVADAIFEACRRPCRLNPPDEAFIGQKGQGVVHGLDRNRADLAPDEQRDIISREVRPTGDRPPDRQSLRGDLNPAATKERDRVSGHGALD